MKDTFANRLQKAINLAGLKPIEVANKTGLDKSLISCYLSGKYNAGDENLEKLANILNVSEIWLRGYDVDINGNTALETTNNSFDELELLFSKTKEILTDDDREMIKFVIEKRKKEIDKQLGDE